MRRRPQSRRGVLPRPVAFALIASTVVAFLFGSSAPTPLYATYQREWGFSPITTTVIFGIYAIAVLSALLVAGRLSDHIGRRPVLIGAALAQAATMLLFVAADGVPELVIARVLQGLATGAAVGAIGAALLDINRERGTVANAVAPLTGTASGALVSGLFVRYVGAPTTTVYLVLLGVFLLQALGVYFIAETVTPKPGGLASLRPSFALPQQVRGTMLVVAPALVAVWSLAGLYGGVGPALARMVTGSSSPVLGGLALFTVAGSGALTVLLLRDMASRAMLLLGTGALIVGVGVSLAGVEATSAVAFFLGIAVAGVGFGAGFQGAVRTVVPLAAAHERAGVLSVVYVVSYLAMGVPAVIAGVLVVHGGGLLATAREYSAAVMVLAALAFVGTAWPRRRALPDVEVYGFEALEAEGEMVLAGARH